MRINLTNKDEWYTPKEFADRFGSVVMRIQDTWELELSIK
jgi:hypothetical protein